MPWITQVPLQRATGLLKEEYDKAVERAGRLWNIVQIMSVNPHVLRSSMGQYGTIMHGDSPLSRVQRELMATVVAVELDCHY
jgi:alkylhydroperoxidase family enzyme|tara:strand:+ start:722 stop:967 length:246 start_codon:yes stop_codon:yes gene_type:complete